MTRCIPAIPRSIRRPRSRALLASLALLVASASLPLAAQPLAAQPLAAQSRSTLPGPEVVSEASAEEREQAARLTKKAQAHYERNEFQQARKVYRAAYQVVPAPELLFNLGQCERRLSEPEHAIFFFQAYLNGKPDAPNRSLVERMIEEQRELLRTRNAEPPPLDPVATATGDALASDSQGSPPERRVLFAPSPYDEPYAEPYAEPASVDNSVPLYKRWWFWTVAGAVLVAAGTTALVLTLGANDAPDPPDTSLGVVSWR